MKNNRDGKKITSFDQNEFTSEILHAKLNEKEFVNKFDVSESVNNLDLNERINNKSTIKSRAKTK